MLDNLPSRVGLTLFVLFLCLLNKGICNSVSTDDEEKALLLLQRSIIRARLSVNRALIQNRLSLQKRFIDDEGDVELKPTPPIIVNVHSDANFFRSRRVKIPSIVKTKGNEITLNKTNKRDGIDTVNRNYKTKKRDTRHHVPYENHEDAYHELPVPMSNANPYMHMRTYSTSPEFGENVFKNPSGLSSAHGVDSLSTEEAIKGAGQLKGSHEIVEGCFDPCHIIGHEFHDSSHLLQQANALKADSKIMAIQAAQLEKEANALKKPIGPSTSNNDLANDYVNVDKPVHILSGHFGKGPERGGSTDFEHNSLNYKSKGKKVDTGYPVYNLPTKPPQNGEVSEYVRPLPPLSGPNPYEVLTSATLGKDYPGVLSSSLANMGPMQSTGGAVHMASMAPAPPLKVVVSVRKPKS